VLAPAGTPPSTGLFYFKCPRLASK
jgi:hypothetical protein